MAEEKQPGDAHKNQLAPFKKITDLNITIVETEEEALIRAVDRWVRFQRGMWGKISMEMIEPSKGLARWAIYLRLAIILLSATVTALSGLLPEGYSWIITIIAAVLTAITGIEGYFKFSERIAQNKRQQRELETLRDELRYRWAVEVELETDMKTRLENAKILLNDGPDQYNDILNKFAIKTEETGAPSVPEQPTAA